MNPLLQTLVFLGIMAVGIAAGAFLREKRDFLNAVDSLTPWAVAALVLLLGMCVGASAEVRRNLGRVGVEAVVIGVATMAGSAGFSYLVYVCWFKGGDHEE